RKFEQRRQKQPYRLRILGLGYEQQRPKINGAPLHHLGENKTRDPKIQKRKAPEYFAVESVIRIIARPVIRLAVREQRKRGIPGTLCGSLRWNHLEQYLR